MAKNIQNSTQNYGRNVNSVYSELRSNGGYLKNNDLFFSIERAISNTSTQNEIVSDFDAQTNRSDFILKGSVTTTSIQSIKNYTKESQKLKPFFSDEILEWSEVVLVLVLILLIVITVIEYVKRICPHFETLDEIFGHKTNIVPPYIYESGINDQQVETSFSEFDHNDTGVYEDFSVELFDDPITGDNAESACNDNLGSFETPETIIFLEEDYIETPLLDDGSEQSRFKRYLATAPPNPKPSSKVDSQQISPHVSRFKKRLMASPVVEKDRNMARNSSSILAEAQQKKAEAILGRNEIEKVRAENEKIFKFEEAALAKDKLNFEKETRKSELEFKKMEMEIREKEIQSRELIEMYRIELEAKNNLEIAKLRHS